MGVPNAAIMPMVEIRERTTIKRGSNTPEIFRNMIKRNRATVKNARDKNLRTSFIMDIFRK